MAALTDDRATICRAGNTRNSKIGVAASTTIYKGSLVARNAAGYAVPAANTAGLKVIGVAREYVANTGSAGDVDIKIESGGTHYFVNGSVAVDQADYLGPCFVEYDATVKGSGIVFAGMVVEVDTGGVWVHVDPALEAKMLGGESSIETVTTGALSLLCRTSLISITGTKAYTLADGLYEGQRKTLRVTVAASTPDGTLTPATFASGTSLDLDAVNESVELEWHATGGWTVVHIIGATIN